MEVLQKTQRKLSYDSAIPLLGIYLRNVLHDKIGSLEHTCLLQDYSQQPNFGNNPEG
jgi:hypothetical protein